MSKRITAPKRRAHVRLARAAGRFAEFGTEGYPRAVAGG